MGKWTRAAQAVKERYDARETLLLRLQALLAAPVWAELDMGASLHAGDTVRYLARRYRCILSHTKALTRRPTDEEYWELVED